MGMPEEMTPAEAGLVFVTPAAQADDHWYHTACTVLREQDPIHRVEVEGWPTFHVISKHADVLEVELHNNEWHNAPRPVLGTLEADRIREEQGEMLRTLIHMDEPDHRVYRGITSEWFLPKNLAKLEQRLGELAHRSVARMEELGGQCDFARDIAMEYPLQVILSILGLPEEDYPRMLKLTQELFGSSDPEFQRGQSMEDLQAVIMTSSPTSRRSPRSAASTPPTTSPRPLPMQPSTVVCSTRSNSSRTTSSWQRPVTTPPAR